MPCGANETAVAPEGSAGTDMSGGLACSLPQPATTSRQAAAAPVDEQPPLLAQADQLGAAALQVGPRGRDRLAPNRDEALLGALAARPQDAVSQVDVADVEVDRLAGAQPARVHELEQR